MLPSSSRVKLNREVLKDVIGLKLVPRRRRVPTSLKNVTSNSQKQEETQLVSGPVSVKDTVHSSNEPGQTFLADPENVASDIPGEPQDSRVGTQKRKKGDDNELKQTGPCTRGKYQQSNPNTRSKCRLDYLRTCNLRLRFTCCSCTASVQALFKQIEMKARGKMRATCQSKAPKGHTPSYDQISVGKLSGRSKPRDMNIKSTIRVAHVAPGGRDRGGGGQSQVTSDTRPTGTRSNPRGLSNTDTRPSPTGLAGSEGSLRRAVRPSGCGLCGDCKYVSPQRKTLGKQGHKSSNPGPELPTFEVKITEENRGTEATQKISVRIDQYPKVTLCDVAQKCDAFCQDCGYMLPDDLRTKVVHCFKQEMRARFRVWSGCSGHNKHDREGGALDKNGEICPRVQSERSVCQSQSLTEHQRHLKERTDAQKSVSNATHCLLNSRTGEGSANCSASFLLGKRAKKGECRTGPWDRDVRKDPGPGSRLMGADIYTDKRKKLGDGVNDDILPTTPDLECTNCQSPEKNDASRDGEESCFWTSDDSQSCAEPAVGGSSFGSAVKGNGIDKDTCGEIDSPTNTDAASSELFCQGNRMGTDELESCSCQRVRAYFWKNNLSCARTYMSWPFSNSGVAFTAHAGAAACPAEPIDPSDNSDLTSDMLPNAPTDPPSNPTHQVSPQNHEEREKDAQSILSEGNGKSNESMSSYSPDKAHKFLPHLMAAEESLEGPSSDVTTFSSPDQCGGEPGPVSASSFPVNRSQTKSSTSDWETDATLSYMSTPLTRDGLSSCSATRSSPPPSSFLLRTSKSVEKTSHSEGTQMTSCSSSCSSPPRDSDSFQTCDSSLFLFQNKQESDEDVFPGKYPPKGEQHYRTSRINFLKEKTLHSAVAEKRVDFHFMLPPMLSPLTSPQGCSRTSFLPQSPGCSDVEEEEGKNKSAFKHKTLPGCRMPQIVDVSNENSGDIEELEEVSTIFSPPISLREQLSPSNDKDVVEEESQDETDREDDVEQGYKKSEPVPSDPEIKASLTSDVLTEPRSSPRTEEDGGAFIDESRSCSARTAGSSPAELTGSERDQSKAGAADDTPQGILDEFTAYEQDILLVNISQEDPELFENLNQQGSLKLGPTRFTEAPKTRPAAVVKTLFPRIAGSSPVTEQRFPPVNIDILDDIADIKEESEDRPWRPQRHRTFSKAQSSTWRATGNQTKNMDRPDANNSHVNKSLERIQPIKTITSLPNHIRPITTIKNGPWIISPGNVADFSRQKSSAYCRLYFSETLSCGFKMCRFQHVPVEGDEKFCIETVARFTKNPMCLQKAGAVFTGYYQNNPPGVYFSMPVLLSLLWSLLKAGMMSDVFSVLRVSLAHKIVPGHEFLLALFNYVREKGLMGLVPELMQLTFKMANAGLVLSVDCLDCVKNTPEVQQTVCPNSVSGKLSTSAPFPGYLNLAQAVVEIELCSKQEDWRRMGEVFRSICQSSQHPILVEQISGRIAIALLSESKDKLSLPFATFAETVCQNDEDNMVRSFLGRIGVSLMLRYHKTHQWSKGRRVVEVLCISKVSYSMLKGLFGNEDRASRCSLVTVATELFLLSGSVEGALNTLRENKWFLSSCSWPCEPADLESRARVLMRLAETTSHRDTLEVLSNLPGLKEPNDLVDISRHCPLFNSHLLVCLNRQTLPVASDTVDFMLSKNLAVDHAKLEILLHKLGKQNLWLRAREVFRHSLSVGYYPGVSAPPGFMTLIVPCQLGEVELALTFEMFITVNATVILHLPETTTCRLSITLKRTQSCESEYLSAGSRLLSAACIPQPKLIVHYKAVNPLREQVFTLDVPSARCWLRHNHLWANEVWTH